MVYIFPYFLFFFSLFFLSFLLFYQVYFFLFFFSFFHTQPLDGEKQTKRKFLWSSENVHEKDVENFLFIWHYRVWLVLFSILSKFSLICSFYAHLWREFFYVFLTLSLCSFSSFMLLLITLCVWIQIFHFFLVFLSFFKRKILF